MPDGDKSLRTKAKNAWIAWWNRNGWKTIAMVAVAFAIVFGLLVFIQRIERVHLDPAGPNWAEVMTAVSTAVLALSTALLAGGAFFAILAIAEARRDRNAVQMTEWTKRWDDEANREARRLVYNYAKTGVPDFSHVAPAGPDRLKESVEWLITHNHGDYRKLFADPNFLEGMAILVRRGGMDFEIVKHVLGYLVPYRWSLWRPTVMADRDANSIEIYEAFEWLAWQVVNDNPAAHPLDEEGNIKWTGFKE
jgi:hypothetical protein